METDERTLRLYLWSEQAPSAGKYNFPSHNIFYGFKNLDENPFLWSSLVYVLANT